MKIAADKSVTCETCPADAKCDGTNVTTCVDATWTADATTKVCTDKCVAAKGEM